jgi:hypothetical protein
MTRVLRSPWACALLACLLAPLAHAQPAGIPLAWDAPALPPGLQLTGYRVYRRVGSGPMAALTVAPLAPTVRTYVDARPHRTARNCYRVTAIFTADESQTSNEVCGAAPPVAGTAAPQRLRW